MTKSFTVSTDLPVDVETAWTALTADGFTDRLAAQVGTDDHETSVTRGAGELTVVMSRSLPKDIPGPLAKVIPSGLRPTQTDVWPTDPRDGSRHATWSVDSPGVPIRISGRIRLEPTGSGCRRVVDGDAKVKIPLVGGKLEGMVAEISRKQAQTEGDAIAKLLAG